jgi:hypothetical protein
MDRMRKVIAKTYSFNTYHIYLNRYARILDFNSCNFRYYIYISILGLLKDR